MAHEAVWTGPDQAVIDLDGDLSAPIATEMPPRPYAQQSGRCLDAKTGTSRVWPAWQESPAWQPWYRENNQQKREVYQ
jgi:hypothetical protein